MIFLKHCKAVVLTLFSGTAPDQLPLLGALTVGPIFAQTETEDLHLLLEISVGKHWWVWKRDRRTTSRTLFDATNVR